MDKEMRRILDFLSYNGESATNEIARALRMNWVTVFRRLCDLCLDGYVKVRRTRASYTWKLSEKGLEATRGEDNVVD